VVKTTNQIERGLNKVDYRKYILKKEYESYIFMNLKDGDLIMSKEEGDDVIMNKEEDGDDIMNKEEKDGDLPMFWLELLSMQLMEKNTRDD
jgi:uncharacterized phage-like protein YoqJ